MDDSLLTPLNEIVGTRDSRASRAQAAGDLIRGAGQARWVGGHLLGQRRRRRQRDLERTRGGSAPHVPRDQGLTAHASGRTGAFDGRQIAWYERLAEALQPLWE